MYSDPVADVPCVFFMHSRSIFVPKFINREAKILKNYYQKEDYTCRKISFSE